MVSKEYLYIGHYTDTSGNYVLKVGTTNNLDRRQKEHTRNYHKTAEHTLPLEASFEYDWHIPLSKYNTLRYEDRTKAQWRECLNAEYIPNDRFVFEQKPAQVIVKIKKEYVVVL